MAAYWWTVLGTAGRGAGAALTRRARAARVPVRASSMATDRKIRPSVRAPTVIWLVIIQWPSWGPHTWGEPGRRRGDFQQQALTRCGDALEEEGHDDGRGDERAEQPQPGDLAVAQIGDQHHEQDHEVGDQDVGVHGNSSGVLRCVALTPDTLGTGTLPA